MSLSIVIVTFKSDHIIDKLIKSIPEKYNILVIENSLDKNLKKRLEVNFHNVQVYLPKENLGYSKGLNFGVKQAKTKYVLCLVADVIFERSTILTIEKICNHIFNFAIIAPTYRNENVYKNYIEKKDEKADTLDVGNNKLLEVSEVDGAAFVINKSKFKSNIMDEKIFMYFENIDMCFNTLRRGEKIYAILNAKFDHLGLQSSETKYSVEIKKNRNWHYCWSKFYFYKKNYNFFYALGKIWPNFFRSLSLFIKSKIKKDFENSEYAKAELSGILNSIINKKSFYRPKIF